MTTINPKHPVALPHFGKAHFVEDAAYLPDPAASYKIAFSLSSAAPDSNAMHPGLQRVARAVNLFTGSGVPIAQLQFVVAVHGGATVSVFDDTHYQRAHQIANPNAAIIAALRGVGVDITVCAQALLAHDVPLAARQADVTLSLSALTTLPILQQQGWTLLVL